MNAVMAGMVPVMVVLMTRNMGAMEPSSLRFWGTMSLATLTGGVIAYPVNTWLVAVGLKHGMGTVRALGAGGHSLAAESARGAVLASGKPGSGTPMQAGSDAMGAMNDMDGMGGSGMEAMGAMAPAKPAATRAQITAVAVLTLLAFGAGLLLAGLYGDFSMRPGMAGAAGQARSSAHTMPM